MDATQLRYQARIIRKTRLDVGLSRAQAAALIGKSVRSWEKWEEGSRPMDAAYWELFLFKLKEVAGAKP